MAARLSLRTAIDYNNWLPTLSARYRVKSNWSVYAQFAEGSVIPPSNVFDVPGGNVLSSAEAHCGEDLSDRLGVEVQPLDSGCRLLLRSLPERLRFLHRSDDERSVFVATGPSNTKGLEAESNIVIGQGLSVYLNASVGSAKYQTGTNIPNGGLWVANAPSNTEAVGLTWQQKNWDVGIFDKRVGQMYND